MQTRKLHPYNEAGRRLKAALVSYTMGRAGVDSTLKQTPWKPRETTGPSWPNLYFAECLRVFRCPKRGRAG